MTLREAIFGPQLPGDEPVRALAWMLVKTAIVLCAVYGLFKILGVH